MVAVLVEITNTENLKNDVKEDVEEVELDYSSIKRLLLIMSGVERNPGPGRTNLETLNWLNENSAKAEKEYKLSYEAEKFFGRHIGTSKRGEEEEIWSLLWNNRRGTRREKREQREAKGRGLK